MTVIIPDFEWYSKISQEKAVPPRCPFATVNAVAAVVLGMLLYPPFHQKWGEGRVIGRGYRWIFNPPYDATVDIGLLLTQWLAVLIIGAIAYLFFRDSP